MTSSAPDPIPDHEQPAPWAAPWHVEHTCEPLRDKDGDWLADVTLTFLLYPSPSTDEPLGWRLTVNNERGYRNAAVPSTMMTAPHLETAAWQLYDQLVHTPLRVTLADLDDPSTSDTDCAVHYLAGFHKKDDQGHTVSTLCGATAAFEQARHTDRWVTCSLCQEKNDSGWQTSLPEQQGDQEEPEGLGAVVQTADDQRYTHIGDGVWVSESPAELDVKYWPDFEPSTIKVLSWGFGR